MKKMFFVLVLMVFVFSAVSVFADDSYSILSGETTTSVELIQDSDVLVKLDLGGLYYEFPVMVVNDYESEYNKMRANEFVEKHRPYTYLLIQVGSCYGNGGVMTYLHYSFGYSGTLGGGSKTVFTPKKTKNMIQNQSDLTFNCISFLCSGMQDALFFTPEAPVSVETDFFYNGESDDLDFNSIESNYPVLIIQGDCDFWDIYKESMQNNPFVMVGVQNFSDKKSVDTLLRFEYGNGTYFGSDTGQVITSGRDWKKNHDKRVLDYVQKLVADANKVLDYIQNETPRPTMIAHPPCSL